MIFTDLNTDVIDMSCTCTHNYMNLQQGCVPFLHIYQKPQWFPFVVSVYVVHVLSASCHPSLYAMHLKYCVLLHSVSSPTSRHVQLIRLCACMCEHLLVCVCGGGGGG